MEYFDLVLGYLRDNKIIAASIGVLFLYLLIKNFWLLIKLLIFLVLGALAFSLVLSFVGKATKGKKELLEPSESRKIEHMRPLTTLPFTMDHRNLTHLRS
ncbi:MAG: hypothetical protein GTN74_14905 [Proteobacteria bacterium]|nr:hypothetical protein [Pseudomonadota bacterium]NIS71847.1 hypothetical protein [Pseudomonadota bacterium]